MSSSIETCACGTPAPPSVSLVAEDGCLWEATLECPQCGFVALALGPAPVVTLAQAAAHWNALAADPTVHRLCRPRRRH